MNSKAKTTTKASGGCLRLFLFGPGIGEAIVLQLPCGQWGLVDCYQPTSAVKSEVLAFLLKKEARQLAFFCLTHPHADHYLGADHVLEHYSGKIDRIWRHPGFSRRDLTVQALLATKIYARTTGDPEADMQARGYLGLLRAIDQEKRRLSDEAYRRVIGPMMLMEGDTYKISALHPSSASLDNIERQLLEIDFTKGLLFLSEEQGPMLNALSVVLLVEFGSSNIFLLGDAQGANEEIHPVIRRCTAIKIAHHGSDNGLSAEKLLCSGRGSYKLNCGLITPYRSSGLPRPKMVEHYQKGFQSLRITGPGLGAPPRKSIPGLRLASVISGRGAWTGIEISARGEVKECPV